MSLISQFGHWFGKELKAYNFETLTVTNAAKKFTVAKLSEAGYENAIRAVVTVAGDSIRYRLDGTDPSDTVGHIAYASETIVVEGTTNLTRFRMFRVTTDATVTVTYERYAL